MESLAWSICARPLQLLDAPSPRSYVFTLLSEVRSPIRRRWAECSRFDVTPKPKAFSSAPAVQQVTPTRARQLAAARAARARARQPEPSQAALQPSSSTEPGSPHSSLTTRRSPFLHRTTRRPTAPRCAERKFSSRATAGETTATCSPRTRRIHASIKLYSIFS